MTKELKVFCHSCKTIILKSGVCSCKQVAVEYDDLYSIVYTDNDDNYDLVLCLIDNSGKLVDYYHNNLKNLAGVILYDTDKLLIKENK